MLFITSFSSAMNAKYVRRGMHRDKWSHIADAKSMLKRLDQVKSFSHPIKSAYKTSAAKSKLQTGNQEEKQPKKKTRHKNAISNKT